MLVGAKIGGEVAQLVSIKVFLQPTKTAGHVHLSILCFLLVQNLSSKQINAH